MDKKFMDQLETWHQQDEFDKIIAAIEAVPQEQWGYELTGLLARACSNAAQGGEHKELYLKAIDLLERIREEGQTDPNWHFRMGFALYWLDREPEAVPYFSKVLEIIPGDPETQEFWSDCRELLAACEKEANRRRANQIRRNGGWIR